MTLAIYSGYDPARSGAVTVILTETGGGGATGTATLTTPMILRNDLLTVTSFDDSGTQITTDLGYDTATDILTTALNAIGNATYTCTFSTSTQKMTLTASGGGVTAFTLTSPSTAFTKIFGTLTTTGSLSYVSANRCWYQIQGLVGGLSDIKLPYESADDLASDMMTNDGSVFGTVMPGSVKRMDFVVPCETKVKTNIVDAYSVSNDWTWEHLKRHARNIEPLVVDLDGVIYVVRLRADDVAHVPQQVAANYLDQFNIPFRTHFLGVI